jgi:glucose/mannose-6-phosphate isomerase
MSILDRADGYDSLDPNSMKSLLESLPEQIRDAAKSAREAAIPVSREIRTLVITGLGGSAIGGDLIRSIAGPRLKVPLIVNRDYELPKFADPTSFVVACSYSGNTEETLSAYQEARRVGACILCITSGGQLGAAAKRDLVPVLSLPAGLPPRAALGYSLITLLFALQSVGIIPDMTESANEAAALLSKLKLRYGTRNPEAVNPAKSLARSLWGKVIAIYGSSGIMDTVAYRWRTQIAENAKNLAFHHALPEMNHNELVGWLHPEETLRRVGVVFLRDRGDHPQVQRRFDLSRELIEKKAGVVHEAWSEGRSLLARVMSLVYIGDFVSLYLAYLNGSDPTPVKVIDYFKTRLSSAG